MVDNYTKKDIERVIEDQKIISKLEIIQADILDMKAKLEKNFVTKEEFNVYKASNEPYLKAIRYTIAFMLIGVLGALAALIGLKN